ncbi:MAG: phosphotransferase [Gammaproteobacteria bacterium]|nr:phosphotransferase [Gammaproteobacteria bacterium]
MPHDPRLDLIQHWLAENAELHSATLTPASVDASFRRYFRASTQHGSYIVMDAPPEHEKLEPFSSIARLLEEHDLNVPHIYDSHVEHGFLLLSDLGSTQYLNVLSDTNVEQLYGDALDALFKIQTRVPPLGLPLYDKAMLEREMHLFEEWFLRRHLGIELSGAELATLKTSFEILIYAAINQPQVFVHRDYHSRNLMVTDDKNPGILDFQDAVLGPVTYDLVSLLRDCYIEWPQNKIDHWVERYFIRLQNAGITNTRLVMFQYLFDLMGAQRHLKAIGIFSRLNYRDGKSGYLNDIPRTFNYLDSVCNTHMELHDLATLFKHHKIAERLAA